MRAFWQPPLSELVPGTTIPEQATLEVAPSEGTVDVHAAFIDNGTGDPVVYPFAASNLTLPASVSVTSPCAPNPGAAGLINAGTVLSRADLDPARHPDAVCNEGTPGVFYSAAGRARASIDGSSSSRGAGRRVVPLVHASGTWKCGDAAHVREHRLTTPFFLRQDLLDPNTLDTFGTPEWPYGTQVFELGQLTRNHLDRLSRIRSTAEEKDANATDPGVYGPRATSTPRFGTPRSSSRTRSPSAIPSSDIRTRSGTGSSGAGSPWPSSGARRPTRSRSPPSERRRKAPGEIQVGLTGVLRISTPQTPPPPGHEAARNSLHQIGLGRLDERTPALRSSPEPFRAKSAHKHPTHSKEMSWAVPS